MSRGIIASSAIFEGDPRAPRICGGLSREDVRYYALYWDKIVIPDSKLISFGIPDQDVLVETGVVSRPFPSPTQGISANMEALVLDAQASFAKQLIDEDRETDWVLHQIGSSFHIPEKFGAETRTVRVELQKTLPVPNGDVPIVDILEFKDRRRDELMALHQCLDEAYLEVLRSPDLELARHSQVERLKKTIADLDAATNERWKITKKFDLSAELNLDGGKILAGIAAAEAFNFYSQTGVSIPITAMVAGTFSLIKISAKRSTTFEAAKNNMKLGYLSRARNESILP